MHVALSWRLVSRASSDVARSSGRAGTALLDRRHPHRRWLLRATTARAADGEPFLAAAVSRFLRDSPSRGHYALRAPVTRSRGARGRRRVPVRGLARRALSDAHGARRGRAELRGAGAWRD